MLKQRVFSLLKKQKRVWETSMVGNFYFRLFENFFFSHITLLERHLEKLKAAVENAYYNKKQFFALVMEVGIPVLPYNFESTLLYHKHDHYL